MPSKAPSTNSTAYTTTLNALLATEQVPRRGRGRAGQLDVVLGSQHPVAAVIGEREVRAVHGDLGGMGLHRGDLRLEVRRGVDLGRHMVVGDGAGEVLPRLEPGVSGQL